MMYITHRFSGKEYAPWPLKPIAQDGGERAAVTLGFGLAPNQYKIPEGQMC